jgi:hypothetical protein
MHAATGRFKIVGRLIGIKTQEGQRVPVIDSPAWARIGQAIQHFQKRAIRHADAQSLISHKGQPTRMDFALK